MSKCRVAISQDVQGPDGSPAFPSVDLSPLDDPRIDWSFIPVHNGRIDAADMEGYDALILLSARFDAESIPTDGRLALVARFGVGYDTVDIDACTARGVAVVITPDGVRRPVAVAIMTMILALAGRLMVKDRLARQGPDGWAQCEAHMGEGLVGKTLGSLGMGNIGAEMFRMAHPFDMRFAAHDPFADEEVAKSLGVELVTAEELFRRSDFFCVNCPLTDETRHFVNAVHLGLMKPTAYLINTARGPIVDQAALTKALQDGTIAGAGLDVFVEEPPSADDPLFGLDNVIVTPHALCWTDECFAGICAANIAAVFALLSDQLPSGIVNRDVTNTDAWQAKLKVLSSIA